MSIIINRALLDVQEIDSGRITQHVDIIRQVTEPGVLHGTIVRSEIDVFQLEIEVSAEYPHSQTNIALHNLKENEPNKFLARKDGFLVFHTRRGYEGYRVILRKGETLFLDNERLNNQELIVITPLRAGTYSVRDVGTGTEGQIHVLSAGTTTLQKYKQTRESGAIQVKTKGKIFDPPKIELLGDQPALFTASRDTRLVVEREKASSPN
jgi:hypothetical protein